MEIFFFKVCRRFSLNELQGSLITFVNPFSWLILDDMDKNDLTKFKIFADGIGVVWFYNFFLRADIRRYSFDNTSVAPIVFNDARDQGKAVFLIGGKPGVVEQARARFELAHPGIKISGTSSGFFNTMEDRAKVIESASTAEVVVVGMGSPHQEQFLLDLQQTGWLGTGFTCGGFFDQTAEKGLHYFPNWVNILNIRWLYRLLKEPRRLGKRYLIKYPYFALIFFYRYILSVLKPFLIGIIRIR